MLITDPFGVWCDCTGFDCQGGMNLYLSKSLETLVNNAMDREIRYQTPKGLRSLLKAQTKSVDRFI